MIFGGMLPLLSSDYSSNTTFNCSCKTTVFTQICYDVLSNISRRLAKLVFYFLHLRKALKRFIIPNFLAGVNKRCVDYYVW